MGKWDKVAAAKGVEIPPPPKLVAVVKETKEQRKARAQEAKRKEKAALKRAKLWARDPQEIEMEEALKEMLNGPEKQALQADLEKLMGRNKKKQDKRKMKRIGELRELINLFEMPEEEEKIAKAEIILKEYNEELDELQGEFDARAAALAAEEEARKPKPRPPTCPEGYKWGQERLSKGATFDAANLMLDAAREGDLREFKEVYQLLGESGYDMLDLVNTYVVWPEGWNALHCAAYGGHLALTQHLINIQADITIQGPGSCTALSLATDRGHRKLVGILRLRGQGLARELYFNYECCVEPCSVPGCTTPAQGVGGVCFEHMQTRMAIMNKYTADNRQLRCEDGTRGTRAANAMLQSVLSHNQTSCVGGAFRPEWRPTELEGNEDSRAGND